jgi:hypothetical protein
MGNLPSARLLVTMAHVAIFGDRCSAPLGRPCNLAHDLSETRSPRLARTAQRAL